MILKINGTKNFNAGAIITYR